MAQGETSTNVPTTQVESQIESARHEITLAAGRRDPRALKQIHDQATALEKLVSEASKKSKSLGSNLKKLNDLARIRILAAREMGVLLRDLVRRGGPRYRGRTLDELGISRNQSAKWQKIADAPNMVDAYVEMVNNRAEEASVAGYLRFAANAPHFSSESSEWYTPLRILEAVQNVLGEIDLDPCSNDGEPNVPAKRHLTIADDGLAHPWSGKAFMNPPYGRALPHWVRKFRSEFEQGRMQSGIALLPARPGSDWFEELSDFDVCFIRGRLRFSEGNPAPFPSMCLYCGTDRDTFLAEFRRLGCLYSPIRLSKD